MDGAVSMWEYFKIFFCSFLFLVAIAVSVEASEYELSTTDDTLIGLGAAGMIVVSESLIGRAGIPTPLDNINFFDRHLIFNYSQALDDVSTISAYVSLMLPLLSLVEQYNSLETLITYGIMYAEAFFLTMATKDLLKIAISRHRPYTYRGRIPPGDEDDYYNSFPSGHTAFAFLGATFLSVTYLTDFPDSSLRLPIVVGSYTLAGGIGVLRILSGNHFATDVIVGGLIGALYGWLIPWLHEAQNDEQTVSILPSPNGVRFSVKLQG